MICYRDRTFCSSTTCANVRCDRLVTEEVREAAKRMGLDIAASNLRTFHEHTCGYVAKEEPGEDVREEKPRAD